MPPKKNSNSGERRIATLHDTRSDSDHEDDDDEPQTFYTGGEKSGMMVQNPDAPSSGGPGDVIKSILKQAADNGTKRAASSSSSSSSAPSSNVFQGGGYKLGSDEVPSQHIVPPATDSEDVADQVEIVSRRLTFWQDGFSIDDGPLMKYDDPVHKPVLDAIQQGRAPLSLFNLQSGQQADVKVAHRMKEAYVAPKKIDSPFGGSGQRLGSVVPGNAPNVASSASASTPPVVSAPVINASLPTVSIQLRLGDGTRVVGRFNSVQTVGDVYAYVESIRPGGRAFELQTSFPVKQLKDKQATLEAAGLANAVIIQRFV